MGERVYMLRLVAQLACQMSPGIPRGTIEQLLYLLALGQGQATVEVPLESCRERSVSVPNSKPSFLRCT